MKQSFIPRSRDAETHDAEPQDTHERATPGNRKLPLSTSFHFQQPSISFSHPHVHQN